MRSKAKVTVSTCIMASVLLGWAENAATESSLPLITIDQLVYQGAFRKPGSTYGSSSANYSYGTIGYNPNNHSIYLAGHEYDSGIAEFKIPEIVNSMNLADLKMAADPTQGFADVLHKASVN